MESNNPSLRSERAEPDDAAQRVRNGLDGGLSTRLVDHDDVFAVDQRVLGIARADRAQVEQRGHPLALDGAEHHHRRRIRQGVEALGHRHRLQQRGAAGDREDAGLAHRALDRHALAGEFLHEHADLRVLQVGFGQLGGDQGFELGDGLAARLHRADQRQRDHAAGVHAHLAVEVVELEDGDLQHVQRANAVVGHAREGAAFGGGVGLSRVAPGTLGTLLALGGAAQKVVLAVAAAAEVLGVVQARVKGFDPNRHWIRSAPPGSVVARLLG